MIYHFPSPVAAHSAIQAQTSLQAAAHKFTCVPTGKNDVSGPCRLRPQSRWQRARRLTSHKPHRMHHSGQADQSPLQCLSTQMDFSFITASCSSTYSPLHSAWLQAYLPCLPTHTRACPLLQLQERSSAYLCDVQAVTRTQRVL